MTPQKVLEVIEVYRQFFIEKGIPAVDYPYDDLASGVDPCLEHCYGMLDKMVMFVREMRMEKVFRWLGFIQGVLWAHGIYTLNDLKNHSRPSEGEGS